MKILLLIFIAISNISFSQIHETGVDTSKVIIGYYDWDNPCPCIKVKDKMFDSGMWPGVYAYTYVPDTLSFPVLSFDIAFMDSTNKVIDKYIVSGSKFDEGIKKLIMESDKNGIKKISMDDFVIKTKNNSSVKFSRSRKITYLLD